MNKKLFLAAPFKNLMNMETATLEKGTQNFLIRLIDFFESRGYEVHNAHKREQWGQKFMPPEQCTKIDFDEIEKCDLFVALPGIPASPGTHIEIGWASAMQKNMILLLDHDLEQYAYLVRGLHTVCPVDYVTYHTEEDCIQQLEQLLQERIIAYDL